MYRRKQNNTVPDEQSDQRFRIDMISSPGSIAPIYLHLHQFGTVTFPAHYGMSICMFFYHSCKSDSCCAPLNSTVFSTPGMDLRIFQFSLTNIFEQYEDQAQRTCLSVPYTCSEDREHARVYRSALLFGHTRSLEKHFHSLLPVKT